MARTARENRNGALLDLSFPVCANVVSFIADQFLKWLIKNDTKDVGTLLFIDGPAIAKHQDHRDQPDDKITQHQRKNAIDHQVAYHRSE